MSCKSQHPGGLRLTDRAARLAGVTAGMRLLDIGCGDGVSLHFLAHKYEIIPHGIDKYAPNFTVGDAANLPYPDKFFDAVICECVLSLVGERARAISEMHRVLQRDGVLIVSDICDKGNLGKLEAEFTVAGFGAVHFEEHRAALITYAAEMYGAKDTFCGNINNLTYYLLICAKR